uniref:Uncharacterized protein n=1 Tax=Salix viminalis TaxID=40686 RepID=A0A6N2L664_SALVM
MRVSAQLNLLLFLPGKSFCKLKESVKLNASQLHAQRQEIIQITSGSRELDKEGLRQDLLLSYMVSSALEKLSCATRFALLANFR